MIEKVKEMLSKWPKKWSSSEKHIAELVLAAADNEILDILSEYTVGGRTVIAPGEMARMASKRCFLCAFRRESSRVYAICFGSNPTDISGYPKVAPYLERASRASDFVSALLNVINRDYNCFFVPTNIGHPSCGTVKKRLRLPDESQVTYVRESDLTMTADDRRTYELEFVILASVGEHFRRMNDCVIVKSSGKDTYEYEYHREDHTILTHSQAEAWAKVNAAGKASRAGGSASRKGRGSTDREDKDEVQSDLQSILEAVQRPEEKKRILDVFAAAPASEFARFMRSLENEEDLKVGQINLTPCSIFVSSIPQKTYVYAVTDPEDPTKSAEFSLVWNKPAEDFSLDTPLYVDAEGGVLKGLTYMGDYADPDNPNNRLTRHSFDADDTLVIARTKDNGRQMTLRLPTGVAAGYKDVICAVYVERLSQTVSQEFRKGYYPENEVKFLPVWKNNSYYSQATGRNELRSNAPVPVLSADLAVCPVAGVEYWNGDVSQKNVLIVDDDESKLKNAAVYVGSISPDYARRCSYCGTEVYATEDRWTRYQSHYRLLDGSSACEFCMKPGRITTVGGKKYRLFDNVYDTGTQKYHPLFVEWEDGKNPRPVKDGNAYQCASCERVVYMPPRSAGLAYRDCAVCNSRICPDCNRTTETLRLVTGTPLCKCCLQSPPGLANQGKTIHKAWNKAENKEEYVLDGINKIETIFHCAECDRLIYRNPGFTFNQCGCCGKMVGDDCWSKLPKDENLNLRMCKSCRSDTETGSFKKLVIERDTARALQKEIQTTAKRKEAGIIRNWHKTFEQNLKQYLPYMTLADRNWLKRNKNKPASFEINVHECLYLAENETETVVVHFSVKLKKRRPVTYTFLNDSGRIVVGG